MGPSCRQLETLPDRWRPRSGRSGYKYEVLTRYSSEPLFRLTSEGSLVRSQLRPPGNTRSEYISILSQDQPGTIAGATRASSRAWKRAHRAGAASCSIMKVPGVMAL